MPSCLHGRQASSATCPEGQWGGGADTPGRFDVETGDAGTREVRCRLDGIVGLDDEEALDDGVTTLRSPAAPRVDVRQSIATTAGNAAFDGRPNRGLPHRSCAANASYARSSKRTNRTSSTSVSASRTVSTAMRAASSNG